MKVDEEAKTAGAVLAGLQAKTSKVRTDKATNFKPLPKKAFAVKATAAAPKTKKSSPQKKTVAKITSAKKF